MKSIKKLTRREFAHALRFGLGRAVLHVKEYGDDNIEEEIKKSMIISHAYDVQIEGLRSRWLWDIITLTCRPKLYGDHLQRNFGQPGRNQNNIAQQFELASCFFELGMTEFRQAMWSCFEKAAQISNMGSCGEALVEVCGLTGLELVARTCGAVPESLDEYECSRVLERASVLGSERTIMEHMGRLAEKEEGVRAFMDACKKFKTDSESVRAVSTVAIPQLDDLLAMIQRGEKHGFPGRFGKRASEEDLKRVLDLLKDTIDEGQQIALLRVFNWRAMPEISSSVIELLHSDNPQVRRSAATALSHSKSRRIRVAALSLLRSGKSLFIPLGLDLLRHNYVPGDLDEVSGAVKRLRALNVIHSAGMAVHDICKASGGAELAPLVLWLYENGPDSFCRCNFLEQLFLWQKCPDEILYEAQWDSGNEVQDFARQKMARYEAEGKSF